VLRVALSTTVSTLNPFLAVATSDLAVLRQQYESLVCNDQEGRLIECLALSVSSDDGLLWTYQLSENRVWSDGVPITAADVVFSLRTMMDATGLVGDRYAAVSHFTSLSTSDTYTLTLTLDEPSPIPPGVDLFIVPRHVWKDYPDLLTNSELPIIEWASVASGPFLVTTRDTNRLTMRTNPLYWRGPAKVAGIEWLFYPDNAAALLALQADEVDVVSDLSVAEYESLTVTTAHDGTPNITKVRGAGARALALHLNFGRSDLVGQSIGDGNLALTDPVFRAAIATSLDLEQLIFTVFAGFASPGLTQAVPAYPAYAELPVGVTQRSYDTAAAKQSLIAAGYQIGSAEQRLGKDGLPVILRLGYDPTDELQLSAVSEIEQALADLAVAVVAAPATPDQLAAAAAAGLFDLYLQTRTAAADPGVEVMANVCSRRPEPVSLTPPTSDSNAVPATNSTDNAPDTGWCEPDYDALAFQQAAELGSDRRAVFVRQAYAMIYSADVMVILGYPDVLSAYRSDRFESFGLSVGALTTRNGIWAYYLAMPIVKPSVSSPNIALPPNRLGWYAGAGIVIVSAVCYGAFRLRVWWRSR
jgi:peptide/nickel transport system substrate-binding protein